MARQPRSKEAVPKSALLQALEHCALVTSRLGLLHEMHISLRNRTAIAFNGILAAGALIDEDILAAPHNELFLEALSKCNGEFSLTQLANGLSVKSGKFKAVVPTLDPALLQSAVPDPPIVNVNNSFREAVEAVSVLANENAQHVLTASVLMNGATVIATNRVVMFEAFHGNDLPPNVPLPKQFVSALCKSKKNLKSFGLSHNSVTFYFEDDSWLRTQLYAETWPNVDSILNTKASLWPIDPNFFKAVEAVLPFSDNGGIYFGEGVIRSHPDDGIGASHETTGTPKGVVYPGKQLLLLKGFPNLKIDYAAQGSHHNSYCLVFQSDIVRGVISGRERV